MRPVPICPLCEFGEPFFTSVKAEQIKPGKQGQYRAELHCPQCSATIVVEATKT